MTPKQERFVEQYLLDLNATQAAIRAGYSERTANEQGAQLLKKPEIVAAIDAAKGERSEKTKIDAAWVLIRLTEEAEADIADIFDEDTGDLRPVHEWPEIWRRGLVAGVEIEALFDGRGDERRQIGHAKKVRFSDRIRRIELIGKHIGVKAFETQLSVNGLDGLAERLERAAARRAPHAVVHYDCRARPSEPVARTG
ncbi:terminase small subunit [Mesorhizobium sp.]|uniref:terminase small subunit n=1 Tax=Mesorhizobium sp. TaxID=1871066 RepID=UPI000FE8B1B5|nr:terminase small subunit [Mesorhizobium sp.]RWO21746.1 MAG: terminase small subunit [Mesorhizobium sp.]